MKEKINNLLSLYRQSKYFTPLFTLALLIVFFIAILLVSVVFNMFSANPSTTSNNIIPPTKFPERFPTSNSNSSSTLPTRNPSITPAFTDEQNKINSSVNEQPLLERDHLVSVFINSLPYQGTNVIVTYTVSDNVVHVVLSKSNQALGNQEFNALLTRYKIQSNWIPSLKILSQ